MDKILNTILVFETVTHKHYKLTKK